jgi:hypothetical protein
MHGHLQALKAATQAAQAAVTEAELHSAQQLTALERQHQEDMLQLQVTLTQHEASNLLTFQLCGDLCQQLHTVEHDAPDAVHTQPVTADLSPLLTPAVRQRCSDTRLKVCL